MTQHRSGGDRSTRTRRNQAPLPKNPRRGPAAGAQREGACRAPCDCVYAARESERASETACARASTDRQATAATHQSTLQPLTLQPLTDSAHEPMSRKEKNAVARGAAGGGSLRGRVRARAHPPRQQHSPPAGEQPPRSVPHARPAARAARRGPDTRPVPRHFFFS